MALARVEFATRDGAFNVGCLKQADFAGKFRMLKSGNFNLLL